MRGWSLNEIDVEPQKPEVLDTEAEGRIIVLNLPSGATMQEHQVHERAWLLVVSGAITITGAGGETTEAGTGYLAQFDPNERREIRAGEDTRLLLLLSPWPGEGHPSQP
jgi:quercetin dioxygenase-like cupin family protein